MILMSPCIPKAFVWKMECRHQAAFKQQLFSMKFRPHQLLAYEAYPSPPPGLRDGKNTPRGRVEFQFRHNVCGRRMYADGTADAVEFIANKAAASAEKRVYNMVDILKEGGI